MVARLTEDEAERIAVLHEHRILDSPPDEVFDDLVRLAASLCGTPIASVTLIDELRQWHKAVTGSDTLETSRDIAFCAHTILQADPLIVQDTLSDPRFADTPLVIGEPHIRFYAGVPLLSEEGYALGTLCVVDTQARQLTDEQIVALNALSRHVMTHLELRRALIERERAESEIKQLKEQIATLKKDLP